MHISFVPSPGNIMFHCYSLCNFVSYHDGLNLFLGFFKNLIDFALYYMFYCTRGSGPIYNF